MTADCRGLMVFVLQESLGAGVSRTVQSRVAEHFSARDAGEERGAISQAKHRQLDKMHVERRSGLRARAVYQEHGFARLAGECLEQHLPDRRQRSPLYTDQFVWSHGSGSQFRPRQHRWAQLATPAWHWLLPANRQ